MPWDHDEILASFSASECLRHDDDEPNFLAILRNNPEYFIAWYGPDRGPISGAEMIAHLFEYSRKPRSLREIENYEFSEFSSFQDLIFLFIEAFLTIQIEEKRWSFKATRMINWGKNLANLLVTSSNISAEYLPAVEYLHRWILANIILVKEKSMSSRVIDIANYGNYAAQWEKLPLKSKALLHATKCFFFQSMRLFDAEAKSQALQELRQVVKLDPLVYEWHYLLGNWIRCERICLTYGDGFDILKRFPTEEEMQTLWETYDVCTYMKIGEDGIATNLRRRALAGVCQGVAEVVRHRGFIRLEGPFTFGGLRLANNLAGLEFIREQLKVIQDEGSATFGEYIRFGEIFASILPYQFRDYKMAEKFYTMAYSKIPSNSKINHKLGSLYFTSDELRDIPRSIDFLRHAIKSESSNVPAVLDLLGVMMASASEHLADIEEVIQSYLQLSKTRFPAPTESELKWTLGCAKFMTGSDKEDAVTIWISSQELSSDKNIFAELVLKSKRYRWNDCLINLGNVKSTLENSLKTRNETSEVTMLQKMIETLPTPPIRKSSRNFPRKGDYSIRGGRQEIVDSNWRTSW